MYSYFLRRFCSQRFVDQSQCYNATRVVSADGLTLVKQQQYPKSWDSLLHVLRCTTHVLRFITVKAICHAISPTGTSGYDAGEWLGWLGWNHRTSALREEQYVIRCGQQIVVHYPLLCMSRDGVLPVLCGPQQESWGECLERNTACCEGNNHLTRPRTASKQRANPKCKFVFLNFEIHIFNVSGQFSVRVA